MIRFRMPLMATSAGAALTTVGLLLIAGCGDETGLAKRYPVSGTVTYQDKPGVYFFSLDAANLPAVWAARTFYHLPYFHAEMSSRDDNGIIRYSSRRHRGQAGFEASYQGVSSVCRRDKRTLEHFLTERYCLYTTHDLHVYRGDIHHLPWPLQNAEAEIRRNTVAAAAQIAPQDCCPLLHFAKRLEVLIWPLRRLD